MWEIESYRSDPGHWGQVARGSHQLVQRKASKLRFMYVIPQSYSLYSSQGLQSHLYLSQDQCVVR